MRFQDSFVLSWGTVRRPTIRIAEAMPEDRYDFRITPEARSFKELLLHIVSAEQGFLDGALEGRWEFDRGLTPDKFPTKEPIINLLRTSFERSSSRIKAIDDNTLVKVIETPFRRRAQIKAILWAMRDHENNHNGYLSAYLRANGIKPPMSIDLHNH